MPRLPQQDLDHVLVGASDAWKDLRQTRIFLTGGTGFVGSWLLETLLYAHDHFDLGISVTVLTRDPAGFQEANPHLTSHPAVELLRGDVRTFDFPPGEFPFVIHAATPDPLLDVDVEGMRHVLEFAGSHGTRRFLFTSSGAVYGKQPPEMRRIPEDYCGAPATTDPGSAYGHAKRASEFLCAAYGRQYGFGSVIARLFAFTGPRLPLDRNFAVGNFVRDVLSGGPIRIHGDGTPYRSYLYAADLALWLWVLAARAEPFRPYNVGSGEDLTIVELASVVAEVTAHGMAVEIAQQPVANAPATRYVPSVERARGELGLHPAIALKDGIRRMHAWAASSTNSTFRRSECMPVTQ